MTLSVRLDAEENDKLDQIVRTLQASDRSSAVRALIEEKWRSLQEHKSFVQRRGGHPVHLLHGSKHSSERDVRKSTVSESLLAKVARRKRSQ